jgi:hypothetical protein
MNVIVLKSGLQLCIEDLALQDDTNLIKVCIPDAKQVFCSQL